MKKLILLTGTILFFAGSANAGILSDIFNNNNGIYYPPSIQYGSYYRPPRYYNNRYYNNRQQYNPYQYNRYYYNPQNIYRQPIIHKSRVKRSLIDTNEKLVANKTTDINKIEQKILFQTYEYDNMKNRIERLEQKIFGAVQAGDLAERFDVIKSAAKNYKAYMPHNQYDYSNYCTDAYRPPIFTGSMGSGWRNTMLGNLKNQMMGMPTGFTPAMDPAFMDYFEADRATMGSGKQVDYRTNRGYYRSNTDRGTGMGVTILD